MIGQSRNLLMISLEVEEIVLHAYYFLKIENCLPQCDHKRYVVESTVTAM